MEQVTLLLLFQGRNSSAWILHALAYYYRIMVQPEGHPGDHDDHQGGDVDGDDVVGDLALESHVHSQTAVFA